MICNNIYTLSTAKKRLLELIEEKRDISRASFSSTNSYFRATFSLRLDAMVYRNFKSLVRSVSYQTILHNRIRALFAIDELAAELVCIWALRGAINLGCT